MITRRRTIGAHAFFFPEGAIITPEDSGPPVVPAVLAGRGNKPIDGHASWVDLGIGDWTLEATGTFETLMAPQPGMRVAYDEIQTSGGITLTGTLKEMSNLMMGLVLGAAAVAASPAAGGAYVPLAGKQKVNGWLKLDQYDQDNVLVNEIRVYVSLRPTGALPNSDAPVDIPATAILLYSAGNTGDLA